MILRPTIFLDIDGVLNTPHTSGFQTVHGKIEPSLVKNLNLIGAAFTGGINIVISSHWRVWHDLRTITAMLQNAGMSDMCRVIGKTDDDYGNPHGLVDDHGAPKIVLAKSRGQEIADWLLDNPTMNAFGRWAILDDNSWMLKSQAHRFVQTDPNHGLTRTNALRVISILMSSADS